MPFIGKKEAFQILKEIKSKSCDSGCRRVWFPKIKKAVISKTNPLDLTLLERQRMKRQIESISGKKMQKLESLTTKRKIRTKKAIQRFVKFKVKSKK
jgi:hypothetical protein